MKPQKATLLCSSCLLGINSLHAAPDAEQPKNILFVCNDDLNDWPGSFGGYKGKTHTPNSDRLVARGVKFSNANSAALECDKLRADAARWRLGQHEGRDVLLAPSGQPVFLLGINHLNDGLPVGPDRAAALKRALDHLRAWGFNNLG